MATPSGLGSRKCAAFFRGLAPERVVAGREDNDLFPRSRQEHVNPLDVLAQVRDLGHQTGVEFFQIFDLR